MVQFLDSQCRLLKRTENDKYVVAYVPSYMNIYQHRTGDRYAVGKICCIVIKAEVKLSVKTAARDSHLEHLFETFFRQFCDAAKQQVI